MLRFINTLQFFKFYYFVFQHINCHVISLFQFFWTAKNYILFKLQKKLSHKIACWKNIVQKSCKFDENGSQGGTGEDGEKYK